MTKLYQIHEALHAHEWTGLTVETQRKYLSEKHIDFRAAAFRRICKCGVIERRQSKTWVISDLFLEKIDVKDFIKWLKKKEFWV